MMMLDIALRNGLVFDGNGHPGIHCDVGVRDGEIVRVGRLVERAVTEIDAEGCYVAPGFVDVHSHSDYTLLVDPRAVSSVAQGVTTEVVGNCGFGCFPIEDPAAARQAVYGYDGALPLAWRNADEYLAELAGARPCVNVATLAPNGQLRLATRALGEEAHIRREALLEESLLRGAWGFSVGLEYPVETTTTQDELLRLCRLVAAHGGLFAAHTRHRDRGSVEAVKEVIDVAARADVRLQISHLAPRSGVDDTERCLELVEVARSRGLDVHFDMHTRRFGTTYLSNVLPAEELTRTGAELDADLRDERFRTSLRGRSAPILADRDWGDLVIAKNDVLPELSNRTVREVAEERDRTVEDTVYDILGMTPEAVRLMVLIPCYTEQQQDDVFIHPLCVPASDATALATDGPLASQVFHGAYTWAAWYWRHLVIERGLIAPQEAIFRLSGLPATIMGWSDRGRIQEGSKADVVVFEPDNFHPTATVEEPNRLAVGMSHVIVNGMIVLEGGRRTDARPGQVLR